MEPPKGHAFVISLFRVFSKIVTISRDEGLFSIKEKVTIEYRYRIVDFSLGAAVELTPPTWHNYRSEEKALENLRDTEFTSARYDSKCSSILFSQSGSVLGNRFTRIRDHPDKFLESFGGIADG